MEYLGQRTNIQGNFITSHQLKLTLNGLVIEFELENETGWDSKTFFFSFHTLLLLLEPNVISTKCLKLDGVYPSPRNRKFLLVSNGQVSEYGEVEAAKILFNKLH